MLAWKMRIFVRVVTARMGLEQITAEVILQDYPDLTFEEKQTILDALIAQ